MHWIADITSDDNLISSSSCSSEPPKRRRHAHYKLNGSLQPCPSELRQQLLRAQYITFILNNAFFKNQILPKQDGWLKNNGKFDFMWFEGHKLPAFVNDVIIKLPNDKEFNKDNEANHCSDEGPNKEDDLFSEILVESLSLPMAHFTF